MKWTPERTSYLQRAWQAGEPGEVIATVLGVSMSAVCAKADRLRLPARRACRRGQPACPSCADTGLATNGRGYLDACATCAHHG